jgi:hypothetical protein
VIGVALAAWLALGTSPAAESPALTPASPVETKARLEALRALLDSESARADAWTWGWSGAYVMITIAQLVPVAFVDADTRIDLWVGAVSSVVGAVLQGALPLRVPSAEGLPDEPDAALAEAERRAAEGAEHERQFAAWYSHCVNVAVNAIAGLVLGLGYQHWVSAALSFGVGVAVGEVVLFTQPTRLLSWARGQASSEPHALRLVPFAGPRAGGLALVGAF